MLVGLDVVAPRVPIVTEFVIGQVESAPWHVIVTFVSGVNVGLSAIRRWIKELGGDDFRHELRNDFAAIEDTYIRRPTRNAVRAMFAPGCLWVQDPIVATTTFEQVVAQVCKKPYLRRRASTLERACRERVRYDVAMNVERPGVSARRMFDVSALLDICQDLAEDVVGGYGTAKLHDACDYARFALKHDRKAISAIERLRRGGRDEI